MLDIDWSDPETLRLNVTNAILGAVMLFALLSVIGAVAIELYGRLKKRFAEPSDSHILHVPGLGLTMADGGEKIDDHDTLPSKHLTSTEGRQSG